MAILSIAYISYYFTTFQSVNSDLYIEIFAGSVTLEIFVWRHVFTVKHYLIIIFELKSFQSHKSNHIAHCTLQKLVKIILSIEIANLLSNPQKTG